MKEEEEEMEKKRETQAILRCIKASMLSIGIAWHQGVGNSIDSETVWKVSEHYQSRIPCCPPPNLLVT